ncbi:uncharacterized protein [Narcine bancroftii]|uniref:uncharacterized protein isoform X2 n=1 Tax=Narcine bancroftii TaxID=1343680 RepID=UPI003831832B
MQCVDLQVIATTPPTCYALEEPMSQSSSPGSGTHLSNVSGFSLGEAIVQRAKQDIEFCPLLQMNTDAGELMSATASHLLLTSSECTQTLEEIPTMEEGTITMTEETSPQGEFGQFQTPQRFEQQENILSPALALVTACSTQNGLSLSLLHRSSLEFASLRAAPDLSVASHEGSQAAFQANKLHQMPILEVSADCVKGSLSMSPSPSWDVSEAWVLSQHPLTPSTPGSETTEDEDFTRAQNYIRDQSFMELGCEFHGVSNSDLQSSLDLELSTCPCSQQRDFSCNSGHQTEENRHSSSQQSQMQQGAVICGTVVPELEAAGQQGCNSEPPQDLGDPVVSAVVVPDRGRTADEGDQTCPDASQETPSTGALPAFITTRAITSSTESFSCNNSKGDIAAEVLTSGSNGGREQVHEDRQSSPTACAGIDSYFTPPVAGPIYQSTPASMANKVLDPSGQCGGGGHPQPTAARLNGVPLVPAFVKLESSRASEKPSLLNNGRPMSAGTGRQSPVTERQSSLSAGPPLPPLSHMEKIQPDGAWRPGSQPSFNNLVLHGMRTISPCQCVNGSIADSLSHMLVQVSGMLTSDLQPTCSMVATLRDTPLLVDCLHSVRASDGPGNSSQLDSGRESPDHGPLCELDSSLRFEKDGAPSLERSASQPSCGASPLNPRPRLEKDSVDQSLSECHVISPGPDRTSPLGTDSVEDAIDPPTSSLDTSQAGEHTLTMSGHSLTSLEVDNCVPAWGPPSLTSESNLFNIDDRIPDDLRNLGINQAPSNILGSKGPLRGVELDLKELRNVRETVVEGFQAEEGVPAMDRDSESSFHTDVLTHSTIPLGSEAGRISPCPREESLGATERSVLEPTLRQWPMSSVSILHPAQALSLVRESVDEGRGRTPLFPGGMLTQDSLVGESVKEGKGWTPPFPGRTLTQDSVVGEAVGEGKVRIPPFPGRTLTQDSLVKKLVDEGRVRTPPFLGRTLTQDSLVGESDEGKVRTPPFPGRTLTQDSLVGESVDEGKGWTPPFPGRTLTQDSLVGEAVDEGKVRTPPFPGRTLTQDSLVRKLVDEGRVRTPPFPGRTLTQDSFIRKLVDEGRVRTPPFLGRTLTQDSLVGQSVNEGKVQTPPFPGRTLTEDSLVGELVNEGRVRTPPFPGRTLTQDSLVGESVDEGRMWTPPFPGRTLTQDSLVRKLVDESRVWTPPIPGRTLTKDSLVGESVDKGKVRTPLIPYRTLTQDLLVKKLVDEGRVQTPPGRMRSQDLLVGVSVDEARTLMHDWSITRGHDFDTRCQSALFVSSPSSVGESAVPTAAGDGMEPQPLPSGGSPWQNDSFVGAETLSEIRKLLGKAGGFQDSGQGEAAFLGDEVGGELICPQGQAELVEATDVGAALMELPSSRDHAAALRLKTPARTAAKGRWRQADQDETKSCRGITSGGKVSGPDPVQGHSTSSLPPIRQAVVPHISGPPRRAWVHASVSVNTIEANSHTDSLDAQNSSPLAAQGPTEEVRRLSPAALDKEPSTQGWEGTKQSVWPPDPLSMLSEEDRRRIEEIKAELLQQSETSINSQVVGLEEAEDLSLASNNSGSVLSFTTPRSLDTARSQICSQLQGASDTTVEPQTPLQKNMEKLPEAVGVPRTDFPLPIATITFSSRRRPLSTSPFPSATLLKSPPTGHREPIGYTQLSAAEVPSEPEHGEQLAGKVILSPTKAAARTVLSHVRVTLSPNRPDIPNVCSADEPLSLCKPLLPASDSQAMAMDLAPRPSPPPKDSVLGSASPPYPPWPMPMPSLWPKCPPLFDHSSEAELPVTREPPSQTRILATQDANKVDVSTQTSGQAPSPPAAPAPSEAQLQDGQSRVERTLSIPALMTGGTAAVSGCTSTTDGPLMLPYKPAGSSRLFYMANARLRQRSDLVDSENGSELSQSGTRPHQGLLRAGTDSFKRLPIRDQRGGGPDPSSAHGHWRCPQQRQQDAAHQWTPASTTIRQAWPDLRGQWDDDWPDPHEQGKEDWSDPHEQRREDWSDPHEQGREDRSDLHEHGREDWSDPHEWGREDWSDPCVQLAEPSLTYKELAKVAVRSADAEGSPENGVPGPGDPQWWEGTEDLRCSADLRLPLQQGMERGPPQWNGADLRLSRQSVVDPKPPWWGGVEPISSWQGADPGPPQRSGAELSPSWRRAADLEPPQRSAADLRPAQQSVVDLGPLRRGAGDPGPPRRGAGDPGPPRRGAGDPGPPRRGAGDPGPPRRGAGDPGPPRRGAGDPGPPRRGAGDPGPPRRGAGDPGPPRRGAGDPGPPRRGAGDPGPPRRGAGDPGPPRRGAGDPGPPRRGAGDPGPPRRGAGDPGPPRRGAGDPGPPRRGAGDPGPPRRGAAVSGPLWQGSDCGRPWQGRADPGPSWQGGPLHQLWERLKERQHQQQSLGSSTDSELSLLERMHQLAQFLRAPVQAPTPSSSALLADVTINHILEHRRGARPSTSESETASIPSTIDTARLIRAFGPERVLPLACLYNTIQQQRESSAHRREQPQRGETRYPGTRTAQQADSVSPSTSDSTVAGRRCTRPPRGPSSRLVARKGARLVDQGVQAAVAWFVPAHELQGVGRKENVPEPRERLVEAWGLRKSGHMRRREPLRQIHLQGIWNPSPRGKSPSSLVPLTLREALGINRPWFISRSRERQRRLSLRTYERRFQNLLQSEREQLFNRPPAPGPRSRRGQRTDCSILYKKKISKQEMLDRSRRLYEQLPEVTRRRDEEKRRAESQTNRLRAQLYKQKITNHILGKKVSWQ